MWQHRNHAIDASPACYAVPRRVGLERHPDMEAAISREKPLRAGSRRKKLALIEAENPAWRDLYEDICG